MATILILPRDVEVDHAEIIVRMVFEQAGYDCKIFSHQSDVFAHLEFSNFDLLFIIAGGRWDRNWEFYRRLRVSGFSADLPTIVYSAIYTSLPEGVPNPVDYGDTLFLRQDFFTEDLIEKTDELFNSR